MKNNTMKKIALYSLLSLVLILALPLAHAQEDIIPDSSGEVALADTEAPSDVENVQAIAGDGQVTLTWDVATDNEMVQGYKIYYGSSPVVADGDTYEAEPIDAGNKITYDVPSLDNGTTYYFAVTAYDAESNESENYSVEVSATPSHGAADSEAPKVSHAEASDKFSVLVTFSEAINLPAEPQSAFTIVEDGTSIALDVLAASMDINDSTNKTVVLTTSVQKAGSNYILTAGIEVTDLDGNPIESGTSDTALFTGTDLEAPVEDTPEETEPEEDTVGPELVSLSTPDSTTLVVAFSEAVQLSADPTQNFIITEEDNSDNTLEITSAVLDADGLSVTLTTATQKDMNYFLIARDVADMEGNLLDVANNAAFFKGFSDGTVEPEDTEEEEEEQSEEEENEEEVSPGEDSSAPEDATNFLAKLLQGALVQLTWTASPDSAGDLSNYLLYKSTDGKVYSDGVSLSSDKASHDLSGLVAGVKYYYKLTAQDDSGNESEGVVTSFMLPETGPELALLLFGSLGAGRLLRRKKKNRK